MTLCEYFDLYDCHDLKMPMRTWYISWYLFRKCTVIQIDINLSVVDFVYISAILKYLRKLRISKLRNSRKWVKILFYLVGGATPVWFIKSRLNQSCQVTLDISGSPEISRVTWTGMLTSILMLNGAYMSVRKPPSIRQPFPLSGLKLTGSQTKENALHVLSRVVVGSLELDITVRYHAHFLKGKYHELVLIIIG